MTSDKIPIWPADIEANNIKFYNTSPDFTFL